MAGFTGSDSAFHNTIAHGLGKIVGCEKDTSEELVACLRSVEADDFRNSSDMSLGLIANVTGLGEELPGLPFPPFVDDKLMKQHPVDAIREKAFTKTNVDIMIGAMAAEGAVFLPMAMSHMLNESEISLNRSEYEAMYPMFVTGPVKQNTVGVSAIKLIYMNWEDADLQDSDYIDALVQMIGDENFICPMDLSARAYAQSGAKVYLYHMTHTPANSIWRIKWMGPAHAEDIPFVFGWHFFHGANWTMPPEEVEMSLSIMKYWTNFAKTGNPNCQSDDETYSQGDTEREWPLFQVPELAYKELSLKMETKRALKAKECAFWNDFVPKLLEEYGSIGKCLGNEDEEKKYTEERH
ncbi:acetylcholinesterase-like [Ptychodera flava]|uniref:acetylcholinesterase-like n=1 Tax=Ptychodera flava TaxID=63121 RepID=UPI00396A2452